MSDLSGKELKKWRKIKLKLEKEDLSLSSIETCHVAVANGGLGNGVDVKTLAEKVKQFGNIKNIVSLQNKSYAELTFSSINEAVNVTNNLQSCQINKTGENNMATLYFYFLVSLSNKEKVNKDKTGFPDGLVLLENFISVDEENELLKNIFKDSKCFRETLKHRTVFHYGYKFRYGSNDVDLTTSDGDLPSFCDVIIDKMLKTGHMTQKPDQLTINIYEPGEGIPLHTDNVVAFGGCLATLSLGSQIVMEMRGQNKDKFEILLKRRTLLFFTGDSRYKWEHGIKQRKTDILTNNGDVTLSERGQRVSLTFRKVVRSSVLPNNFKEAETLELQHVHHVYDNIASHFSSTREKPWPKVVQFLESLDKNSFVLDVGCGSGRYLGASPNVVCLGCDHSLPLLETCDKGLPRSSFACDGQNIPIRSGSFDACICIAVIHHFSTNQRRVAAIKELLRLVATGGRVLIYVWAVEQRFNETNSNYLKKNLEEKPMNHNTEDKSSNPDGGDQSVNHKIEDKQILIHKNRTPFAQQDLFVPWKNKKPENNSTFLRFYHVFKQHELENICREVSCCKIVHSYYDNGNWAVILEKF